MADTGILRPSNIDIKCLPHLGPSHKTKSYWLERPWLTQSTVLSTTFLKESDHTALIRVALVGLVCLTSALGK